MWTARPMRIKSHQTGSVAVRTGGGPSARVLATGPSRPLVLPCVIAGPSRSDSGDGSVHRDLGVGAETQATAAPAGQAGPFRERVAMWVKLKISTKIELYHMTIMLECNLELFCQVLCCKRQQKYMLPNPT